MIDHREHELKQAYDAALELARRKPSRANMKAFRRAEKALEEHRISQDETAAGFRNVPEVVDYLDAAGWKISKTSCYDHVKERKLLPESTGRFAVSSVLEYARVHLQKKDGTPGALDARSLQEQKLQEEVERIRIDRQQRELKYRESIGELIRKSDVEGELAKRTGYLKSDLKNVFRAGAVEIIKSVKGDLQLAPELIAYGVRLVDEIMDRYARPLKLGED